MSLQSMSVLEQLRNVTGIVADTGDVAEYARLQPLDGTTNPALICKSATNPAYAHLISAAIDKVSSRVSSKAAINDEVIREVYDRVSVEFGCEILKHVKGVVSTEADPLWASSTERSVECARNIIALYKEKGVKSDRILIKLPATWEGVKAAEILEKEGIHCNMTLIFNFAQAVACAQAGATLISPFVGRVMDWYKPLMEIKYEDCTTSGNVDGNARTNDPGVIEVQNIYKYYKQHGYKTVVMGASFRNIHQCIALAGCDKLTISPKLLDELADSKGTLRPTLSSEIAQKAEKLPDNPMDEAAFRNAMLDDPMANELLTNGVGSFMKDARTLKVFIQKELEKRLSQN